MDNDREDRIRRRAYQLWEGEGSPEGRDLDHWDLAEQHVDAEDDPAAEAVPASPPQAEDPTPDEPSSRSVTPKSPMSDPGSPGGTSGTGGTNHDQDG